MSRLRLAGSLLVSIWAVGIWLACRGAAQAQYLLPATGIDTRVGDLRGYFEQALGQVPVEATTHGWSYSAGVDVSETYDTSVPIASNGNSRQSHDLITRITPSIGVTGDSARLTGNLFYSPSINIYAFHGNQNGFSQNLNGAVTAEVIPDFFLIDFRAYAAEQAIAGYGGPAGTTDTSSSNQALTTSFSISPSLHHNFSTIANAELGYTLTHTSIDADSAVPSSTAQSVNQSFTSEEEHASVGTGEDFGQFNDVISAEATQNSGGGALRGAHSEILSDTASYALSHSFTVTGSIGHEDIFYGGTNPYMIDDLTWSGGVIWSPDPDSSVSVGYGHQQGGSSFYLNATYAATADTRFFARYSQGIGTEAQNLQAAIASSTITVNGVTVDRTTGQPVVLNNNFFTTRPGLFRTTSASASGVLLWPRDLFTLSIQYEETTQLTGGLANTPGVSFTTSSKFANLAWSHDLSDALHTNAMVQYGTNSGGGFTNGNQGSFLLNAGMSYAISDTLGISAQFTVTTGPSGIGTTSGVREIVIVSLHKTFF